MNRRKFLSWLGVGAAAVVVAPTALAATKSSSDKLIENWHSYSEIYPNLKTTFPLKGYADYSNFSEYARTQAMDECIMNAAEELGRAAGLEINRLHESVLCGA